MWYENQKAHSDVHPKIKLRSITRYKNLVLSGRVLFLCNIR